MPIHGTILPNEKKDHDNLHQLFMDKVLSRCWCTCRRCWNAQKVISICFQDVESTVYKIKPMHLLREDDKYWLANTSLKRRTKSKRF